jgi:hypothetical protein
VIPFKTKLDTYTTARRTFAAVAGREVRVAGIYCDCGRAIQASDIDVDDVIIRIICGECHKDVLRIEKPLNADINDNDVGK